MRSIARQQRGGGCHQAHIPRGHVGRQVHHAARQCDRSQERKPPRIGLVLGKVQQLHAGCLQQHLHHQRFGGRGEHQRIKSARQKFHGGWRLLQPGHLHRTRRHLVGVEQTLHQLGHATAVRAYIDPPATQLPQAVDARRVVHTFCSLRTVEQPHGLHKEAAQRHQLVGIIGLQFGRATLHKRHIGLAFSQQLQVVRRAVAGQQPDFDAIHRQRLLVALAKLLVSALRRACGQCHGFGWVGVEPPVRQHQQSHRQKRERTGRHDQIAQRKQGIAESLGHGISAEHGVEQPRGLCDHPRPPWLLMRLWRTPSRHMGPGAKGVPEIYGLLPRRWRS